MWLLVQFTRGRHSSQELVTKHRAKRKEAPDEIQQVILESVGTVDKNMAQVLSCQSPLNLCHKESDSNKRTDS